MVHYFAPVAHIGKTPGYPFQGEVEAFDDFIAGFNGSATAGQARWFIEGPNAVIGSVTAHAGWDGGAIILTTAGAQLDETAIMLNGGAFLFQVNRPMIYQCRFRLPTNLTGKGTIMGMIAPAAAAPYVAAVNEDLIGFSVRISAAGVWTFLVDLAGTGSAGITGTITGITAVADTMYTVRLGWDGVNPEINIMINGVEYGVTYASVADAAAMKVRISGLAGVYLTPVFGIAESNVGAAARIGHLDYVYAYVDGPQAGRS